MPPRGSRSREDVEGRNLSLAMAAEHGAATRDANHAQRPAAIEAGFARAAVDEQLFLLPADLSPRVAIRVDRAPTIFDRRPQRLTQRLVQDLRLLLAHGARDTIRPEAGAMQRLIRIDV